MEEPVGAQYAVQVALKTLKDRCKNLQEMVSNLEEENLNLKGQLSRSEYKSVSVSDFDKLKAQVTELSENKLQLLNKIKMVTSENQELWGKLSRLSQVNHNLGNQLSKINDSLVQYTAKSKDYQPLIRSKTFTQDEPHTKVLQKNIEENGKICADLEEISLKIIYNFAKEKDELDSLYTDIKDAQWGDHIITDSYGFYYDDFDANIIDNFNSLLAEFRATKEEVFHQKNNLKMVLTKLYHLQDLKKKQKSEIKRIELIDKSVNTLPEIDIKEEVEPEENLRLPPDVEDMMCPICSKNFSRNGNFQRLQEHVENHFMVESYEVVT